MTNFSSAVLILNTLGSSGCTLLFAAKILEGHGEISSIHGRVAVGILHHAGRAVVFLAVFTGKIPSPWTLAVVAPPSFSHPARSLHIMDPCEYNELSILYGCFLLLCKVCLRSRSFLLASFSLANYREICPILGAVAAANVWLGKEWLTVFALSISSS